MNLRQFEHVVALAEEGSFARAAQRVHLSQPALSRSIQAIDEHLDMALFDCDTRDVRITPAGQMVVQRARRVLFEARCLLRDVGSVSFGAGPYPTAMLLPAALDELAQSHRNLCINATVDNWKSLLELLHAELLDFLNYRRSRGPIEPRTGGHRVAETSSNLVRARGSSIDPARCDRGAAAGGLSRRLGPAAGGNARVTAQVVALSAQRGNRVPSDL